MRMDPYVDRTRRTAELVDQLHAVMEELEKLHPSRKFPLDRHLVGSLGEAAGEARIATHPRLLGRGDAGECGHR